MNEKDLNNPEDIRTPDTTPEISVNEYGSTIDPAVVVDEADRTVLLTPDETVVFEKEPAIDIVPKNRPRKVYAGMWGRNEIATVAIGTMAILVVVLIYVFLVVPSNREVAAHDARLESLRIEQQTADQRYGEVTSTEKRVSDLLSSEEAFETNYLPAAATGRNTLYQRLNSLIDAYGLVNTTGPDYAPLETLDQQKDSTGNEGERGRDKFRSLFPGVYVSMTVEGTYQNLRRFIREIEAGRDFVIISSVQLEPSDNERTTTEQQSQAQTTTAAPGFEPGTTNLGPRPDRGKAHGSVVSLRMEMAAYFRRPNFGAEVSQ